MAAIDRFRPGSRKPSFAPQPNRAPRLVLEQGAPNHHIRYCADTTPRSGAVRPLPAGGSFLPRRRTPDALVQPKATGGILLVLTE
jgi:hypothetical protein